MTFTLDLHDYQIKSEEETQIYGKSILIPRIESAQQIIGGDDTPIAATSYPTFISIPRSQAAEITSPSYIAMSFSDRTVRMNHESRSASMTPPASLDGERHTSCPNAENDPICDIRPDHYYDGGGIPVFKPVS